MSDSPARPGSPAAAPAGLDNAAMAALASLLWQERELLEHLLFRMVELQHLLSGGEVRWLPKACDELAQAATAVQDHEVVRAVEVDLLSRRTGLSPQIALVELAESAPEPWPDLLLEHRDALRALTLEIDTRAAENRRLVVAGEQATREALSRISGHRSSGNADDPGGYPGGLGRSAHRIDDARVLDQRA